MKLLDGRILRDKLLEEVRIEISHFATVPSLTVVQVGEDPASAVYIRNKVRACLKTGIHFNHIHLAADTTQDKLDSCIQGLSDDPSVHGILLQLPLPQHLDEALAMRRLDPDKDVDGFHPVSLGRLLAGLPGMVPCTPAGIRALLEDAQIETRGKEMVVLGRSLIVGKPAALIFLEKSAFGDATVTICHSRSRDLAKLCRRADILVAAIGKPRFVSADMVKDGAVVVDVGINRIEDAGARNGTRIVGDCDFAALEAKVSAMTPVPGGVGPLTIAMLIRNTVKAYQIQMGYGA